MYWWHGQRRAIESISNAVLLQLTRLDIHVNKTLRVDVLQALCDLYQNVRQVTGRQPSTRSSVLNYHIAEASPWWIDINPTFTHLQQN